MILNSILITFLFYSVFFFSKIKLKSTFGIWYNKTVILSYFVLFFFFAIFIIFFRAIKIFKDNRTIDLNDIYLQYTIFQIILFILIFIVLRKIAFHYTKICYFRLHYIWLSPVMNPKYYKYYTWFFLKILYSFSNRYYNLIYYFNLLLNFFFFILLLFDIFFNNSVLFNSLIFIKYFSIIKLFFMWLIFIATHIDIDKDFYVFSSLYSGDKKKNPFYTDPKYEVIRKNEITIVNDYIVKTFYCVSPDYRKMISVWNKEKKIRV